MNYIHVEGTQEEKPLEFDATTSQTVVYIRKNIERVEKEKDGETYRGWEYDEAQLPIEDFAAVASTLISSIGRQTEAITPWTATKTAYIDDTECIFENIPAGNVTVYCSVPHTVEKQDGRIIVKFEALTEVIDITISIL